MATVLNVGLDETQPVSTPPQGVDVDVGARTVAVTTGQPGGATYRDPRPEPAPEPQEDDEPDVGRYTTVGRIKRRKGTIALALVGAAVVVAAATLLPGWLRKRTPAARKAPITRPVPSWAKRVPPSAHAALALAEAPDGGTAWPSPGGRPSRTHWKRRTRPPTCRPPSSSSFRPACT